MLTPINLEYHTSDNFREQIAVLWNADSKDHGTIRLYRDWIRVCQPGSASFDSNSPGDDSLESWTAMDDYINRGAAGFFHTHPPGIRYWSFQDIRTQHGLAKANGSRRIFHGVQSCESASSLFTCCWMYKGIIFRQNYRTVDHLYPGDTITLVAGSTVECSEEVCVIN